MIEQLSKPLWLPGTRQFDVSAWINSEHSVRLDVETSPYRLVIEDTAQSAIDGTGVTVRDATSIELAAILAGLQANPPHPAELTPLEILEKFTDAEQDAIEAHSRRLARSLFAAIEPVAWDRFVTSVQQLRDGGLITPERFTAITGLN